MLCIFALSSRSIQIFVRHCQTCADAMQMWCRATRTEFCVWNKNKTDRGCAMEWVRSTLRLRHRRSHFMCDAAMSGKWWWLFFHCAHVGEKKRAAGIWSRTQPRWLQFRGSWSHPISALTHPAHLGGVSTPAAARSTLETLDTRPYCGETSTGTHDARLLNRGQPWHWRA